jgi:thiamine-phosphate pyrophosphorylase
VILHALVDDLTGAKRAVEGGATVVQLRLKRVATADVVRFGRPFRELCAGRGVAFVVNDDVEAAIQLAADGVHLGREDDGLERARAAGLMVGLSAQTVEEALAVDADTPDYIGAGPIWPTPTKTGAPLLGLDGLRELCAAVRAPVVAIGGIDAGNAADCIRAGAAGVAVIRAAVDAAALRRAIDAAL